jgi:DNA-binding protein H-NS
MAKSPVMKLKTEIQNLSRKELEKHRDHVDQALAKLDTKKIDEARAALEKHAKELGVSLNDVLKSAPAGKQPRKKSSGGAKAKYRNPDDASQTWTGRGRPPTWYKSRVDAGAKPESMAI